MRALFEWLEWLAQVVASWILRCVRTRRAGELLSRRLYAQLTRLTASIAIVAVALRTRKDGKIEVFLTKRGPTEAYPNRLHVPETIIRPGYGSNAAFYRLVLKEFRVQLIGRQLVAHHFLEEKRGWFLLLIHLVELETDPPYGVGVWCAVENLPETIVEHHRAWVIPAAVRAYTAQQKGSP